MIENFIMELRSSAALSDKYGFTAGARSQRELANLLENQAAELERLRAIVDKLPKCWRLNEKGELVRDFPVTPETRVYFWVDYRHGFIPDGEIDTDIISSIQAVDSCRKCMYLEHHWRRFVAPDECYSTREAAEAARSKR